ncbi:hypothetical protein HYX09_04790 [Candidatus Woesearchaeota archaeon]|nr:hypothetical protein [Candidatus Woesearchaeota archaeon]
MVTKKDRRGNGYVTPHLTIPKKAVKKYDFFLNQFYDDWADYRDGFRDWFRDFKKIKNIHRNKGRCFNEGLAEKRIQMNLKQEKLLKRRKAMKKHGEFF